MFACGNSTKGAHRLISRCGSLAEIRVKLLVATTKKMMAEAPQTKCRKLGAKIIDSNDGCPAKKVCNKAPASALA